MTAKELKAVLATLPDDAEVMLPGAYGIARVEKCRGRGRVQVFLESEEYDCGTNVRGDLASRASRGGAVSLFQTAEQARRERLKKLLAEIRKSAPPWSKQPPWIAERMFQRQQQRELFEVEKTK